MKLIDRGILGLFEHCIVILLMDPGWLLGQVQVNWFLWTPELLSNYWPYHQRTVHKAWGKTLAMCWTIKKVYLGTFKFIYTYIQKKGIAFTFIWFVIFVFALHSSVSNVHEKPSPYWLQNFTFQIHHHATINFWMLLKAPPSNSKRIEVFFNTFCMHDYNTWPYPLFFFFFFC